MPPPAHRPIGLTLTRTSKAVSRAFDTRLAAAGGSLPIWSVLLSLRTQRLGNQRELAAAVGIQGATLTHHLNAMENDGLITRRRDPANRRIHIVETTEAGDALFMRLRDAAIEHDTLMRTGLSPEEISLLSDLLDRLYDNVGAIDPDEE